MTSYGVLGRWHRSSYSAGNGNCVEVARWVRAGRAVRDSKDAAGPMVTFRETGWTAFIEWTTGTRPPLSARRGA
ncbi:DUF397 domain-containing protein [Streptomyces avicenniae]|uniref:DUF397 domain-containing protein n=1 Tax=Streptomyces avicenniae TaxID=500153 RepID=UPI000DA5F924|nr:DUF397 domain-containing protein [Streptomyces avicenniae]